MNFSRQLSIVFLFSFGHFPLAANEVDVLQFGTDSSVEYSSIRNIANSAVREAVSAKLREHFSEVRDGQPSLGGFYSSSLQFLPIPHGAQYDPNTMSLPQHYQTCDGATFTPAWWLPPRVETRRAAHFGTVARIACEYGLPIHLLDAVIAQESGYKSWAVSSAGAMGIMQIMPGTAQRLGLANPFDPIANMRAGARYLRQQLDRFGRIDLALAAYNAGPERRSLAAGYVPAITQTRNYVRTITVNWTRLAQMGVGATDVEIRSEAAIAAVHASGYRSVELVRYDGLNAPNPI